MRLYQVVAKDSLRRWRRLCYTALGVIVGVAVVIAVLTIAGAGEDKIYEEMDKYGANLLVTPAINDVDMKVGNLDLGSLAVGDNYFHEDQLSRIRTITDAAIRADLGDSIDVPEGENIATIAPHLYASTTISNSSVVVVGIDPEAEWMIKSWWEVNGRYPQAPDEAIVGYTAGQVLGLITGDNVTVAGDQIRVVGVLAETGSDDDYRIYLPLATAQRLFDKPGLISSVDIRALCNGCPVEVIADSINSQIAGVRAVAIKQIASNEMNLMGKMNDFLKALAGITLLIGAFGVVNTMMASVHARLKDIGIMKSVGASRGQIMKIFVYEALIIGLVGGVIGYAAGTSLAYYMGPLVFEGIEVVYIADYLPAALGIALGVTILASLYPAWRASQIKIGDSIRSM